MKINKWAHCYSWREILTPVYQKWTDPAGRKSVRVQLNSKHHWSAGHNWQLQATSSNNSILNIILKFTWDIHQYIFTFWAIKCNSTSLKELKSHNVCSTIKLEIKNRKIAGKSPNTWRLNNTFLHNTWVKEGLSREILKYFQLDGSLRRAS